ncbi:MAG: molybdopterin-guanine dinucleotide biosynthesis protein B [Bacillota bacterium]|jgi:molybdopterin-guanine dinucleotide biosynthesis protein B
MRVFSVSGSSKTGKTTTIEHVIRELRRRNFTVGTIKDIHFEAFAIDGESTNTARHRQAGAELVTAWGLSETDILWPTKLPLSQLLRYYSQDFVIIEGFAPGPVPKIITARDEAEIEARLDELTIAIAGRVANGDLNEYAGRPVVNALTDVARLCDIIVEQVFERLPDFPAECCGACGTDCTGLAAAILRGEASREDCHLIAGKPLVELTVDGRPIEMVPFVQRILLNAILGVVKELDGYQAGAKAEIKLEL